MADDEYRYDTFISYRRTDPDHRFAWDVVVRQLFSDKGSGRMAHLTRHVLMGLGLLVPMTASAQFIAEDGIYGFECDGDNNFSELEANFSNQLNNLFLSEPASGNQLDLEYAGNDDSYEYWGTEQTHFALGNDGSAYLVVDGETIYDTCVLGGLACPFVYVHTGEGPVFVGEILRNVIGKDRETTQTLELPVHLNEDGALRVRISEEKSEITYLDAVRLLVDGRAVLPDSCIATEAAWCDVDGRYHLMQEGDLLELRFAVGEVPGGASVALEASGYYVPIIQTVAR